MIGVLDLILDTALIVSRKDNMKLNVQEIKYIRQSLEHRLIYYENKSGYEQFANELKPLIKKVKNLEGLKGKSLTEINSESEKG